MAARLVFKALASRTAATPNISAARHFNTKICPYSSAKMSCGKTAASSVDFNHGKVAFANPFGGAKRTYPSSTTTKCPHCVEPRNAEIAAAIRAKSIQASKLAMAHFALTVTMSVAAYMVTLNHCQTSKRKKHCQTCRCCKS